MKPWYLLLFLLFFACAEPVDHVISTFGDGTPKVVYRYLESDSLNRTETHFYSNGAIFKKGDMKAGKRDGKWQSFYENGTPWSVHYYQGGLKHGDFTAWHANGNIHILSFFDQGQKIGNWVFFDEKGDTALVKEFSPSN